MWLTPDSGLKLSSDLELEMFFDSEMTTSYESELKLFFDSELDVSLKRCFLLISKMSMVKFEVFDSDLAVMNVPIHPYLMI